MSTVNFKIATLVIVVASATRTLVGQNPASLVQMPKVTPSEFNGDLRALPNIALSSTTDSVSARLRSKRVKNTKPDQSAFVGLSVQGGVMPSPNRNFAGLSFADSIDGGQAGAGWPANANGEVGRNHYVEAVNNAFAIYDKNGARLAAFTENSLWSSSGANACNGNAFGDAVVVYDQLADRFILTNFAFARDINGNYLSPFYECIAVAKTSDPVTGGWWLYPLRMDPGGPNLPPVSTLNDSAKFGIWTDCLYMSANGFSAPSLDYVGAEFASLSRTDLEAGAPLTWTLGIINNATDPFTMIPSNLLGVALNSMPPAGTPNYFVSQSTTQSAFEVRKFTAGLNCGSGGSLSGPVNVNQTAYTTPAGPLVAQPNTTNLLDTLEDRLMQKVQYRRIGGTESLWVVHNVQTSPSAVLTEQWAQIDVTGGTISTTPVQQQIYSPDTTLNRWMGSIAADHDGNVALGYSTSNGTAPNFPSIAYSGRLAGDPLNTLPQTETQLIAGSGSQRFNCGGAPCDRWGDFSSMSVDPSDDCTFWYANQYYSSQINGDSGNWQTRIGSFKFPSCVSVSPILTITKSHVGNFAQGQNGQRYTIIVGNSSGGAPTAGTVTVTDTLPAGLTASAISGTGWACVLGTLSCTRGDTLISGASYPPVTITVNVAGGATSPQNNAANASGGGSPTANINDSTIILPASASTTTTVGTVTPEPSAVGQAYSVAYTVTLPSGTPSGNVIVTDGTATNTCTVAAGNCSITSSSPGSKTITVTYQGNGLVSASSIGTKSHVVSGALPISVTPGAGSAGRELFTFVARDALGVNSIQYAQFLFSKSGLSALNGCYISYDPVGNVFYLLSDDLTQWYGLLGGSGNTIGNAQCTIYGATSGSTKAGTDLTTNVDISFRSGFGGQKGIFQFAGDTLGAGSGWISMGTWGDIGDPNAVELISLSPNAGTGFSQTFTVVTADGNGATTIPFTQLVMTAQPVGSFNGNGCFIHYDRASNVFFLLNDSATAFSGMFAGSGSVSNSHCTLTGAGSGGTAVGSTLTVTYNLTFAPGFAGTKQIYMQAVDNTGVIEVWHLMGTWNP